MTKHLNRGLIWGQLLTGLESARDSLEVARRGELLITEADAELLRSTLATLTAIEQRAWETFRRAGNGGSRKGRP